MADDLSSDLGEYSHAQPMDRQANFTEVHTATKFAPVTFSNPIPAKLDQNNFLIWQKQVSTTIKGHRLQRFLSETTPIPNEFVSDLDKANGIQNPAFLDWEQQDQLILSWLLSSMTEGLLSRFVNSETSAQVWSHLQIYFATQVRAKQAQYKAQLENTKKNTMPMSDFLLKIRSCVDLLNMVGHRTTTKEHIDAVFDGLPMEYETFMVAINSRLDPYTVDEIESLLLSQESYIQRRNRSNDLAFDQLSLDNPSVNLAYSGRNNNNNNRRRNS